MPLSLIIRPYLSTSGLSYHSIGYMLTSEDSTSANVNKTIIYPEE
jgi:hypothetical protein